MSTKINLRLFLLLGAFLGALPQGDSNAAAAERRDSIQGTAQSAKISRDDMERFMRATVRQANPTLLPTLLGDRRGIKFVAQLSREDQHRLFAFDLRRMVRELEKQLEHDLLAGRELELLPQNDFFDRELRIEGFRPSLWGSRSEEVIFNDGQTKVSRIYHDWYEVEDLKSSRKSELILLGSGIIWTFDTDAGTRDTIDFEFDGVEGATSLMESLLEVLNIDPDSEAADEMVDAAAGEAAKEEDNKPAEETKPADEGGTKPESDSGGSLTEDFLDEAQKAWDLFVDMIDDAVDYGPDYVDPNDPIIKYVAGLDRLTDLYMQIKFEAIINSDRTENPMGGVVSDDQWLNMMLAVAFYRPLPDSDPVDRPQREDRDISIVGLDFDGAIDYGEDHFPSTVDPDDIPTEPRGL